MKKGDKVPDSPKLDERGRSDEQASKMVGVSRGYVAEAKKIKEASPETFKKLKSGEINMAQAKKEVTPPAPPKPYSIDEETGKLIEIVRGVISKCPIEHRKQPSPQICNPFCNPRGGKLGTFGRT